MKKLLAFLAIVMFVGASFSSETVHRRIGEYLQHGDFDYQLVQTALDSNGANFKSNIVAIIDTVSAIAHRPISAPISLSLTSGDTTFNYIFAVPAGMTATVRAASITCHVEPNAAAAKTIHGWFLVYDQTDTTAKKMSTPVSLDADSSYLEAGLSNAVTLDSTANLSLAAGDVVYYATVGDSANMYMYDGGVTVDVDYNE